jgi:hypothetical protein
MAINVNTVYKTVLLILNKEERGYVTPDEFNKISAQVQLEIFGNYHNDLNQQLRVPQADTDYADRIALIDEHLSIFKTGGSATYVSKAGTVPSHFSLPTTDIYGNKVELFTLGTISYKEQVELQRLQRMEFYNIQKSPLTKSTESFPTYLLENDRLYVKPDTVVSNINVNFLRKPLDPRWGYYIGNVGQLIYDTTVYGPALINTGTGTLTSSITTALANGVPGTYNSIAITGGSGTGLVVNVTVSTPNTATIDVVTAGTGYVVGDIVTIAGLLLGGNSGAVNITLVATNFNANSTYGSTQIELDVSEQTDVILKTLFYFGVVVKDPQIIQVAASQVQREEMNEKS